MTDEVWQRATKRLDAAYTVGKDERSLCLRDRRFYSIPGAMWEDEKWATQFSNVPRLEINKALNAVDAILAEYRKNRVSVDFRPDDNAEDDETAEALNGLYRADQRRSGAKEVYDIAREESASGGFGAWRLKAEYEDEEDPENDHQRVCFEAIPDADQRVWFDPAAKRSDKRDAKWCIVLNPLTREDFDAEHPGASPINPPQISLSFDWFTPDVAYVGEYYEIEERKVRHLYFRNIATEEEKRYEEGKIDQEQIDELLSTGWELYKERKIPTRKVVKYLLSGTGVLSKREVLPGRYIPIIPVYGKRRVIGGIERFEGKVRPMIDPCMLYNAQVSMLAEQAGLAQHERPILYPQQVAGHETSWAEGNINRAPFQLINPILDENGNIIPQGPVGMVTPSNVPPAAAALITLTAGDIREMTGNDLTQDGIPANTSGDAIEMIYSRQDSKYELYHDNWANAVAWEGEVWLSIVADIYVEKDRIMPVVDDQGGEGKITIGEPKMTQQGRQYELLDMTNGNYSVVVEVGPSSQTRRDKTVRLLMNVAPMVANDPEMQNAVISTAMLNIDGEGISDLQDWLRGRMVRAGMVKPNDQEKVEMEGEAANAQPDPNADLAAAAAEQARAEAKKAVAGTVKTLAEAEKIKAETEKIATEIDGEDQRQTIDRIDAVARHLGTS